eukprot:SAG11_NODE_3198_length_2616_cov_1.517282_3_plen_203_part_00
MQRCRDGGGAATMAQLSVHCRAEDFGLSSGVGLRATVSEFPRLWSVQKQPGVGRVVQLLVSPSDASIEGMQTARSPPQSSPPIEQHQQLGTASLVAGSQPPAATGPAAGEANDRSSKAGATAVGVATDGRQPAHTRFRRLGAVSITAEGGGELCVATLLACKLESGRRHQIRRHLAKLGTPILGDVEYGSGKYNRPLRCAML